DPHDAVTCLSYPVSIVPIQYEHHTNSVIVAGVVPGNTPTLHTTAPPVSRREVMLPCSAPLRCWGKPPIVLGGSVRSGGIWSIANAMLASHHACDDASTDPGGARSMTLSGPKREVASA